MQSPWRFFNSEAGPLALLGLSSEIGSRHLLLGLAACSVFFNSLFCIGVQLINEAMLVSDAQQSNSVTHVQLSSLFQTLFPLRLLPKLEQSSLCCAADSCAEFPGGLEFRTPCFHC